VERLNLRLPVLEMTIALDIGQARTAAELIQANPDLQELDRAGEGAVLRLLEQLLTAPLPEQTTGVLQQAVGQPLFEQALLGVSELVDVEGLPPDTTGRMLADAMAKAYREGEPHLLGLLRQVPGKTLTLNLQALAFYAQRLQANLDDARALFKQGTPSALPPATLMASAGSGWSRTVVVVPVKHRSQPLMLTVFRPTTAANGRVVVISHGLWDEPTSFEGWARLLAARGYTVLLPRHPGSDGDQQKAMLAGKVPPPSAEELRLRPMDVTAVLDTVSDPAQGLSTGLNTDAVAVVGHSWGAVTSLQLVGMRTTDQKLRSRCGNPRDPERNISWALQCSWLGGIEQASIADPRVKTVVAVSPPLRLLFDPTVRDGITGRILLVSGTSDWVVPPGPEAIVPMRNSRAADLGHRLVLVSGGDHFNLRAPVDQPTPAVLAPLILAWINEQLGVPSSLTFSGGTWGSDARPLLDVTGQL